MLKRLILKNFMSHVHTEIEFSPGMTLIVGPNNSGKSAIVSALRILARGQKGETKGSYMIRHGTKEARLILETDEGHRFQWRRVPERGSFKLDDEPEATRQKLPEHWDEYLRMPEVQLKGDESKKNVDIHFGLQTSPIFLVDDKAKAAGLFASSSEMFYLLKMQDESNKKTGKLKKEIHSDKKFLKEIKKKIEILTPVEELLLKYRELEIFEGDLRKNSENIERLESLIAEIEAKTQELEFLNQAADLLKTLAPISDDRQQHIESLTTLILDLKGAQSRLEFLEAQQQLFQSLDFQVEISDLLPLEQMIEVLERDSTLLNALKQKQRLLDDLSKIDLNALQPQRELITALENWIRDWTSLKQNFKLVIEKYRYLNYLSEPPTLYLLDDLAHAIETLEALENQLEILEKERIQTHTELSALESTLAAWIEEHPQCPVCGRPWDPNYLDHIRGVSS